LRLIAVDLGVTVTRTSYDRMSAHDAGYLTRETAAQPLHYVIQLDVAGRVEYADVLASVARRLDRLPIAHRRTRYPLLAGRPVWVDDPDFDVSRQVTAFPRELRDDADVDAALVELSTRRLPRDRPLWNLTVAAGPGDRTTLWLSAHHAVMDGSLVADMLRTLFAADDEDARPAWRPMRGPSRLWLLVLVVLRRLQRVISRVAADSPKPSAPPGQTHPTSMTGDVSPARAIGDTTVSLAAVKEVRRRTGATINDLFLAVTTDALRDYLEPLPDVVLALIPRNIRTESEAGVIGNKAWSMLVPLPTGLDDPAERLEVIRAATEAGKATDSTSGTQGWRFDIALTNVAFGGPFFLLSRPVTHVRATVPLQGQNRLVGVLTSYGDGLTITYTADGTAYPDVARLTDLTQRAWERMLAQSAASGTA
jgi:hypothetical protein